MIAGSQRATTVAPAAAAAAGLLAGAVAIRSPGDGMLLAGAAVVAVAVTQVSTAMLVCALIAYLPFEGVATSHLPASAVVWVRYAPEAIAAAIALVLVIANAGRLRELRGRYALLVGGTLLVWAASGVANGVSASTYLLGVRAELRYLPLLALLALSVTPRRDARLLATTVVASTLVQTVLALAELVGGAAVHHLLAQSYAVSVGGLTVTHSSVEHATAVTGSLRTYNELAAFLVAGWAILALAGEHVALPRRLVTAGLVAIPLAVLATGSREGAAFMLVVAAITARRRFGVPVIRIAAVAGALLVVSLPWWAPTGTPTNHQAGLVSRVATRWSVVLQPSTWSGQYGSRNFRLFLARDQVSSVAGHSPLLGWGTGTIDDPRTLASGANPLLRTAAGRLAVVSNFAFDGSWLLILVQSGLLGLACMLSLVAGVAMVGSSISGWHWLGPVLVAMSAGVIVLGLFAPVLQQHTLSAEYWALGGCGIALATCGREAAS